MPKLRKVRNHKEKEKERAKETSEQEKVKDDTGISTGDEKEGLNFPKKGCEWVKLPKKG